MLVMALAKALSWDVLGAVALAIAGMVWLALLLSQVCVPACVEGSICTTDCGFNSPWFPIAGLLAIAGAGLAAWRIYRALRGSQHVG
jgi:LPXTG-motif cell wall-anchored protein